MNIFKTMILLIVITQTIGCAGTAAQKEQRYDGVTDIGLAAANLAELDVVSATVYGLNGSMKVFLSYMKPTEKIGEVKKEDIKPLPLLQP